MQQIHNPEFERWFIVVTIITNSALLYSDAKEHS